MRFQGRGAHGSFERLFLARLLVYVENRRVGLCCAYKGSDFSLFRPSMFIHSMLIHVYFRSFEQRMNKPRPRETSIYRVHTFVA